MLDPNFVLLYARSVPTSVAFWQRLLGRAPVESSPAFALFVLPGGGRLGFWAVDDVAPPVTGAQAGGAPLGGTAELAVMVADGAAVDTTYRRWLAEGVPMAQSPTDMDFGRTFCALDPDGHRLRVYCPAAG